MASALPRPELDRTGPGSPDRNDLSGVASDDLAKRIAQLSSEIAAATCHMLVAIAEFDRRRAWADWGCHSCANWISWKCGLSPGAAQEHVRVARRLVELPQLIQPFARGEISFSKVRAIIRVATSDNIESLLELADLLTAAQLESVTAAFRRVAQTTAAEITGQQHAARFARWRYQDDGSVLICARLDPEEGAVVINALEAATLADEKDDKNVSAETPDDGTDVSAATPDDGTDVSAATPDEGVEDVSAETWPELLEVTAPSDRRSPWETAAADALVAMAHSFLEKGMPTGPSSDRYRVVLHVDEESLLERAPLSLCEIEGGHIVMPETARRLSCDSILQPLIKKRGRPLAYGRSKRTVSPKLKRALKARDKCCRFSGCNRSRVDAHHIGHWVEGGETNPENLVSLCWFHHRLVHEGGYMVKVVNGRFRFYRPDGVHLPQVPNEPVPDLKDIAALKRELGIEASQEGAGGNWDGTVLTFDVLSDCVDALLLADGLTTKVVEKMRDEYAERTVA